MKLIEYKIIIINNIYYLFIYIYTGDLNLLMCLLSNTLGPKIITSLSNV